MSTMTTNRAGEQVHPHDFVQRRRWSGAVRPAPIETAN
jgi:hypothetical protein